MEAILEAVALEYQQKVQSLIDSGLALSPESIIDLSAKRFQEIKVEGISDHENPDSDMLLYQYGIYDWHDEWGEQFSFDITRQFFDPNEDEPYQLSLTLIYDAEPFRAVKAYNCWSSDFETTEAFVAHIKSTEGYIAAEKAAPKGFEFEFTQC